MRHTAPSIQRGDTIKRLSIVLLAAAACNTGPATTSDLNHNLVDALCQLEARCGGIGKSQQQSCSDQGRAYFDKYASYDYAAIDAEITAGRLAIDGSSANACTGAIAHASCSGPNPLTSSSSPCLHTYRGLVKPGGLCNYTGGNECSQGYCSFSGNSTCGGTCTSSFLAEGASCTGILNGCDPSKDFCSQNATCQPFGTAGMKCFLSSDCAADLSCNNAVCSRLAAASAPCKGAGSCVDGYYCPSVSQGTPTCTAKAQTNGACSDSQGCPDANICAGLGTGTGSGGICLAVLDVGDSCDPKKSACPQSAPCDPGSNICAVPADKTGADCSDPSVYCSNSGASLFAIPLYCDQNSKTCQPDHLPGDACTPTTTGSDGCTTSCDSGTKTCTPYSTTGTCP